MPSPLHPQLLHKPAAELLQIPNLPSLLPLPSPILSLSLNSSRPCSHALAGSNSSPRPRHFLPQPGTPLPATSSPPPPAPLPSSSQAPSRRLNRRPCSPLPRAPRPPSAPLRSAFLLCSAQKSIPKLQLPPGAPLHPPASLAASGRSALSSPRQLGRAASGLLPGLTSARPGHPSVASPPTEYRYLLCASLPGPGLPRLPASPATSSRRHPAPLAPHRLLRLQPDHPCVEPSSAISRAPCLPRLTPARELAT